MFRSDKKINVIIRSIAFVLVFIIIFSYVEAISYNNRDIYDGWRYVYRDKIDVLIMGSSQVHSSFEAKYITEQTGKSVVLLSSGAQNIKQTYYNLLEVVKYQKPDLIVIESLSVIEDTLKWMRNKGVNGLALQNLDGMKMSPLKLRAAFSVLGFDGYGVFHIMREAGKTERIMSAFKHIKSRTKKIFNPVEIDLHPERGFVPKDKSLKITKEQYDRRDDYVIDDNFQLLEENVKYMEKVINICIENDIDIEFVKTPLIKNQNSMSGHLALLKYLEENEYDIKAYNLMEKKYGVEMLQEDYADVNHVSVSGARKISEWFAGHIKEYYKDEN
jgi:hypothetical protein